MGIPVSSQVQISSCILIIVVPCLETYLTPVLFAGPFETFRAFIRIGSAGVSIGTSTAGTFIIIIPACRCHTYAIDGSLDLIIIVNKRRCKSLLKLEHLSPGHIDRPFREFHRKFAGTSGIAHLHAGILGHSRLPGIEISGIGRLIVLVGQCGSIAYGLYRNDIHIIVAFFQDCLAVTYRNRGGTSITGSDFRLSVIP